MPSREEGGFYKSLLKGIPVPYRVALAVLALVLFTSPKTVPLITDWLSKQCRDYTNMVGRYEGDVTIVNLDHKPSGKMNIKVSFDKQLCVVRASFDERGDSIRGKGRLEGKVDTNGTARLLGEASSQDSRKVWDVNMTFVIDDEGRLEGTSEWNPKSDNPDRYVYREEFSATTISKK